MYLCFFLINSIVELCKSDFLKILERLSGVHFVIVFVSSLHIFAVYVFSLTCQGLNWKMQH